MPSDADSAGGNRAVSPPPRIGPVVARSALSVLAGLCPAAQLTAGELLCLHILPYLVLVTVLGRLVLFSIFGVTLEAGMAAPGDSILLVHASAIARGFAGGLAWSIGSLRAYYLLAHLLFVWSRPRGQWYPYYPVAWDDLCILPFPRLDLLFTAYAEQYPQAGEQEIERLIETYPAQRMVALSAKARFTARKTADEPLGHGRRRFAGGCRRLSAQYLQAAGHGR